MIGLYIFFGVFLIAWGILLRASISAYLSSLEVKELK